MAFRQLFWVVSYIIIGVRSSPQNEFIIEILNPRQKRWKKGRRFKAFFKHSERRWFFG